MLSPKQAYELFLKKFPESKAESICEWEDFYSCSPEPPWGMSDEYYKIDKKTGNITDWEWYDYREFVTGLPDDYLPVFHKIAELS